MAVIKRDLFSLPGQGGMGDPSSLVNASGQQRGRRHKGASLGLDTHRVWEAAGEPMALIGRAGTRGSGVEKAPERLAKNGF